MSYLCSKERRNQCSEEPSDVNNFLVAISEKPLGSNKLMRNGHDKQNRRNSCKRVGYRLSLKKCKGLKFRLFAYAILEIVDLFERSLL